MFGSLSKNSLTLFAWLSILAAIITIGLKWIAFQITGSVGLLSDAFESLVNLVAAIIVLITLTIAKRPPDEHFEHGYTKVEYFSSGIEGALILIASIGIGWTAIERLIRPQPLEQLGLGLILSVIASLVNLGVAQILFRAGKKYHSITLEADAHHLMTDVWTSGGVLIGISIVKLSGWQRLDPVIALIVAINIIWTGVELIRRSAAGLMDEAIPEKEQQNLQEVLKKYRQMGIQFHALRTRQAGVRHFISFHLLVPGDWTVQKGHDLSEDIEAEIRQALPRAHVLTHLEPQEDPISLADAELDRQNS